jgi:Raf kinase inhibitor-like YbhB/YbcL family protein
MGLFAKARWLHCRRVRDKILEECMFAKRAYLFAATVTTLSFGFAVSAADAAGIFTVKSTTFADGKMMPKKVADNSANRAGNKDCVGDNVSPQLSWTGVPDGTNSFILTVVDPQARGGAGFVHLVAYGIPASVSGFTEGELSKPSNKFVGGKNGAGAGFFSGPCAPANTSPHHFVFVLIATDFNPTDLPPGLTAREVQDKLAPPGQPPAHTKGSTSLVGVFVNPWHP